MSDKKSSCKFQDYVESKSQLLSSPLTTNIYTRSLAEFKLDKIHPRNINLKFNNSSQQIDHAEGLGLGKSSSHFRVLNSGENKFYNQYMNLKEQQIRASLKKNKIAHIFNIRSINLIDKLKYDKERSEIDRIKIRHKYSSKQIKKNDPTGKEELKGLNLILVDKQISSPNKQNSRGVEKKTSLCYLQKGGCQNKSIVMCKSTDNFQNKLKEYHHYVKEHSESHGMTVREVESYPRNALMFWVGRGNNGHLIKEIVKKRWWWTYSEDKNKRMQNLIWTQLKQKSYYLKEKRTASTCSKRSQSNQKNREQIKDISSSADVNVDFSQVQIHNHFQNNQFLGNKKALYYNMKAYYDRQGKNVFQYLPVTFHVKRFDDQVWKEFTKYYYADVQTHKSEERLWIVKPGQNSNRGTGITVHNSYDKIRDWVQSQISGTNNIKKTFIIQKYIDHPLLYNKRKFDIRCYMLLVRLNAQIKGYWYQEGYIRTSCFEFQLTDTDNQFIHLTNDAIQVHSEKYGKYQDGNKLSYHNFQKYLDSTRTPLNLVDTILPQLKSIATDAIEATYHLLGAWDSLPTFQIFGLDFMIDDKFKPWLIEINTNPCLQTSSTTLQRVIPRMVDNAFKLSVDLLFPPPQIWPNSKKHYMPNRIATNLFQLVFDQTKKDQSAAPLYQDIIVEMGQIQQDNQIYDETDKQKISPVDDISARHP